MSDHDNQVDQETTPSTGRRDLLTKAGVAAAVAAVAGLASSQSVEAADGGNMLLGRLNTGNSSNSTFLTGGTSFVVVEGVTAGGEQSSIRGEATNDNYAGVKGAASGSSGRGVYGVSTGSNGAGVFGENSGSDGSGVYGITACCMAMPNDCSNLKTISRKSIDSAPRSPTSVASGVTSSSSTPNASTNAS